MSISEKAVENLIDLLKVTNLAIIAISSALVSNVFLAANTVSQRPLHELALLSAFIAEAKGLTLHEVLTKVPEVNEDRGEWAFEATVSSRSSPHVFSKEWKTWLEIPLFAIEEKGWEGRQDAEFFRERTLQELGDTWASLRKINLTVPDLPDSSITGDVMLVNPYRSVGTVFVGLRPVQEGAHQSKMFPVYNLLKPTVEQVDYDLSEMSERGLFDSSLWSNEPEQTTAYLRLHIPTEVITVDVIRYLFEHSRVQGLRELDPGSFTETFPALSDLDAGKKNFDRASLRQILNAQTQSKGDIEIFGAKIPNELLVQMGVPLLLLLQLQFSAVCGFLAQNVELINDVLASKWSFLLPGAGSVLFAYGAVGLLPVGATVASVCFITGVGWMTVLASILVFSVSAIAAHKLWTLRRKVNLAGAAVSDTDRI